MELLGSIVGSMGSCSWGIQGTLEWELEQLSMELQSMGSQSMGKPGVGKLPGLLGLLELLERLGGELVGIGCRLGKDKPFRSMGRMVLGLEHLSRQEKIISTYQNEVFM